MARFWREDCQDTGSAPVIDCRYRLDPEQTSRPATERTVALGSDSRRVCDRRGSRRVTSGEGNIFEGTLGELTAIAILIGATFRRDWKLNIRDRRSDSLTATQYSGALPVSRGHPETPLLRDHHEGKS